MVASITVDPRTTIETEIGLDTAVDERTVITERIVQEAYRTWASYGVSPALLDQYAREAVDALWTSPPKVTMYVPVLALRHIRARIMEHHPEPRPESATTQTLS